jgi:hypothetical protein
MLGSGVTILLDISFFSGFNLIGGLNSPTAGRSDHPATGTGPLRYRLQSRSAVNQYFTGPQCSQTFEGCSQLRRLQQEPFALAVALRLMIHSASLETAETRRLRQEFLSHVRARPEAVLKNARSYFAGSNSPITPSKQTKTSGPPPLAEANAFAGRPPTPSLSEEVKFVVRNSNPAPQPSKTNHPDLSPRRLNPTAFADAGVAQSSRSSPARLRDSSSHRPLEASGVALYAPTNL